MVSLQPKTCHVAFKEWAGVCAALIEGRQAVIIRKGGISETAGPGEFDLEYRRPGFWILGARVWRSDHALAVPITSEQAGCKTWVALEHPPSTSGLRPVLDDDEWARRRDRLRSILDREHDRCP